MNAPVDCSHLILETPRLRLRPWRMEDLADFNRYASVDGVGQMAGWSPHRSMQESRKILQMFIDEKKTLALELRQTGQVIGSLGLECCSALPDSSYETLLGREIGYVLSKEFWGQGLMPEAVQRVISWCFEELEMDFLTCGHFVWNQQSRRVIEKCGFVYCRQTDYQTRMGTHEETCLYVLKNPVKCF